MPLPGAPASARGPPRPRAPSSASARRAPVYRAILEDLTCPPREGPNARRGGARFTELRANGGNSQSDAATQLTVDVFDLSVARPRTYEIAGIGAAIDSAVGLGLHRDTATRSFTDPSWSAALDPNQTVG